ncbi:uncharacterized protein LOC118422293 [Branchiostoma floridae]|uniref:ubiquitinyl hydrolase 1 n=1 Tax=Branchiostoma floridae TaxID=7739 RepID=A0A9J7LR43_BRAFL|nr:uncharacterized protein LOC118422293 [Branchiostoma floridae]
MEKVNEMPRSPSFVDIDKTRRLRDLVLDSIQSGRDVTGAEVCYLGAMTGHSLMLPPISMFPLDFQEDLNKLLIDRFMQKTLEEAKVLNWCRVSRPLTPVPTTGDGNCLLHAVCQYMWGIHDRDLTLRRLLNRTMVADMTEDMKRRWNRSCKSHNQHVDLEYASLEWKHEWNIVVSMTDPTPNPPEANDLPYKSLEEFHIFVLANLLRRPIIILAEDVLHNYEGHTFAPIHFSGIYLPLRWKPEECVRSPIILGYLQQHFTPLLSQEEAPAPIGLATGEYAVPLVKHDLTMLTVQFLLEHEENQAKELLQKYLDLMELPYTRKESISMVLAAKLNLNPPPEEQDLIKDFFHAMEKTYKKPEEVQEGGEADKLAQNKLEPPAVNKEKAEAGKEAKICDAPGCEMYGTPEQNGLCAACFRESRVSKKPPGPAEAAVLPADDVPNSSMWMRECRTPGCQYFCSIATGEYCHECYEKINGDQRRREVEVGRATKTAKEVQPPAGNPNKCITEGCNNDRNSDNENLCDVCFVCFVTKSGQPPSVHPLKQTERASSLGIIPTTPQPLHSIENRTNSQSLGHISDFTPAKCIIPECQRTGYPKTNDMCKRCYIDQQCRAAGAVAAAIPTVTTPVTAVAAAVTTMAAVLTHISSTFTSAKTSTPGGSPTCKTAGCEMFGAPGQDGYCSQCYLMELGKKSRPKPATKIAGTQQTVATAPQRPAEEVYSTAPINDVTKARYFKKCKTTDCFRVETSNGLCPECYTKESGKGRFAVKTSAAGPEELVLTGTGAEGGSNNQISTQSETRPPGFEQSSFSTVLQGPIGPQTGASDSTKCLIEGCPNLKLENTGGRCYRCLKKVKIPASPKPPTPQPAAAPSSTAEPPPAAPTSTASAAFAGDPQPVPSLVERKQCPAPHCDAYGDAMYNNLCSKCYHTLKEYHSKKPAASANPLPNGPYHSSEELPANTIITAGEPPASLSSESPTTADDNDDPPPAYYDVVSSPPSLQQQPTEVASAGTSTVMNVHMDLQVLQEKQQERRVITANHSPINNHEEQKEKSLPIPVTNNSIHTGRAAENKEGDRIILHEKVEEVNAAICVDGAQQVDMQMEALSNMSAEAFTPTAGNAPHFGRGPCPSPNPAEEMPINMEQESTKLLRPREPENQAPPPKRCAYAYASISSDDLYRSSASNTNVTSEALCSNSPVTSDVPSSKPKELVASSEEESSTPHSLEAPSSNSEPLASSTAASAASMGDAQPILLVVNQNQCRAPHCDAIGDARFNGLCSKCFHILKEYHSKKPAASANPLPNGPHHSPEELPANTIITAGHGASVVVTPGNVTMPTEEGGTVSVARTTTQLPVPDEPQPPCVNAAQGCEMFGTKEQMGFCFRCFCEHTSQQAGQPPVNHPPQTPVNQPPQPANQHQGETPLWVLAEVAGASHYAARLPRQRCIAPGCDMHGELENLNMCFKCYMRHIAEVHRAKDIEAHRAKKLSELRA